MTSAPKDTSRDNFFSSYKGDRFSSPKQTIAERLFTNTNKPVFVAKGLPPVVAGALISRHSHSTNSMRKILVDEYLSNTNKGKGYSQKIANWKETFDIESAEKLFEKVYVGWGHDSLAATVNLVVGFDGVSQLAAKAIENNRLGLAPIERSTRYGFFGQKKNGQYNYTRPPKIMNSKCANLYQEAIDNALDLYVSLQKPLRKKYQEKFPDESKRNIKHKVFDSVRILLTAAAKTNLGVSLNVQTAENMITKLRASRLQELQELGLMLQEEIGAISPPFIQRLEENFGKKAVAYRQQTKTQAETLRQEFLPNRNDNSKTAVSLVDYDQDGEEKIIARILSSSGKTSYHKALVKTKQLDKSSKNKIIKQYVGRRPNRKSHIGRPFEEANLSFRLVCRFAEWRDLQRNRILTPFWDNFDYSLGFDIGQDLKEFGFSDTVRERLELLQQAFEKISRQFPYEAQYLIAFATRVPYEIKLNFRELATMTELRTGPGTHKDYAKIAAQMVQKTIEVYPLLEPALQFVNFDSLE